MPETALDATAAEVLASTPGALRTLLTGVPPQALEARVDAGWSAKDAVAHLLDTEGVAFTDRIRRLLAEDRPSIAPIDPSERLHDRDYASWPLDRLIASFERTRADSVAVLRALSAQDMARLGDHAEAGEISVSDLAHYAAVHDLMHLAQIARMLQTQLAAKVGNMERYLDE
jgi:hypothetical protein